MEKSPEIQVALRLLLVALERPAVLQEWQYREPRKDVVPERSEGEESYRPAA